MATITIKGIFALLLGVGLAVSDGAQTGSDIAAKHRAFWPADVFKKGYETKTSSSGIPMGNGDFKAILGKHKNNIGITLLKNDFWRLSTGYGTCQPKTAGRLTLSVSDPADAGISATQEMKDGRVGLELASEKRSLKLESVLYATTNIMMLGLTAAGGDCRVALSLNALNDKKSDIERGTEDGISWLTKSYTKGVMIPTSVTMGMKICTEAGNASFTVKDGETVHVLLSIASRFKHKDTRAQAIHLLKTADIKSHEQKHAAWWDRYWEQSWVSIPSLPGIEKHYYQSLYGMGAASRDPEFPPGIFGWETTDTPGWHGDYHMNYNHFAPFYALYSANRIEQADPQDAPMLDFMDRAREYAKVVHNKSGLLFPVGIGPRGMDSTLIDKGSRYYKSTKHSESFKDGRNLLIYGQKSNSAYAAVNFIQRWRTTQDLTYARERAYPFVKGVTDYWEEHLVFEDNRYVIYKDSIHEGSGENVNPILGLGLVPNVFKAALEMSTALKVDTDKHETWNHILKHMSGWTFQDMKGKKVFRYTEEGIPWFKNNTLGIQHIYPSNAITLDSPPELLQISRNTALARNAWEDHNGTNSFYPACVRIGLNPDRIISGLQAYARHIKPNGFRANNPHGIENYSTTPNTVNMMMCMSVDHVLRIFPVWPKEHDAEFRNIRAWGAFLVSGGQKDGIIGPVTLVSEKGKTCTLVNPWPGKEVHLTRSGNPAEVLKGDRFTFNTGVNETIVLNRR